MTLQEAYDRFRATCLWSYRKDLKVDESHRDWIIRMLRTFGGREGIEAAAELRRGGECSRAS
jgi:hypothetical protein